MRNLLREDESGLHYIDYLRASLSEFDNPYVGWLGFLQSHKELVENGRDNSPNATVRRKYVWLMNYHNAVVDEALSELDQTLRLKTGCSSMNCWKHVGSKTNPSAKCAQCDASPEPSFTIYGMTFNKIPREARTLALRQERATGQRARGNVMLPRV